MAPQLYKLSSELLGHTADVRATCAVSDELVLSCSRDSTARAWRREPDGSWAHAWAFEGAHQGFVSAVSWLESEGTGASIHPKTRRPSASAHSALHSLRSDCWKRRSHLCMEVSATFRHSRAFARPGRPHSERLLSSRRQRRKNCLWKLGYVRLQAVVTAQSMCLLVSHIARQRYGGAFSSSTPSAATEGPYGMFLP
jgi:hypothetical protein